MTPTTVAPTFDHRAYRRTLDALTQIFRLAVKERNQRSDLVEDGDDGWMELAYVVYERKVMWVAVNLFRVNNKLDQIDIEEIRQAQTMASGHSDFGLKFPLYCAELAFGIEPRP